MCDGGVCLCVCGRSCHTLLVLSQFVPALPCVPLPVSTHVVGGLQHQSHKLLHVKGVVGELGVLSQCGVVTLYWEKADNKFSPEKSFLCLEVLNIGFYLKPRTMQTLF